MTTKYTIDRTILFPCNGFERTVYKNESGTWKAAIHTEGKASVYYNADESTVLRHVAWASKALFCVQVHAE